MAENPRARGANNAAKVKPSAFMGKPPRSRGELWRAVWLGELSWENPRARGANALTRVYWAYCLGKPPRSRGEPSQPDNNYHTLKLGSKSISADHY